jgi:hypothetical protein
MFDSAGRALWPTVGLAALLVAVWCALAPSPAAAATCPNANADDSKYTGNCGPWYALPNWTDMGGWDDPSQYSTIRLADVNGDGKDELIGRSAAGLQIHRFDTTFGQWRPQVDANGVAQMLIEFASFPPWEASDPKNPTHPWYYSTIQAADIDGQPGEEILARFWDGMRVYKYTPPTGGNQIDGGTWAKIGTAGPFSDADDYGNPSLYPTIQVAPAIPNRSPAVLFARKHSGAGAASVAFYVWQNGAWSAEDGFAVTGYSDPECGQPSCYLDLQSGFLAPPPRTGPYPTTIIGRRNLGVSIGSGDVGRGVGRDTLLRGVFADVAGSPDCPFSNSGATGAGSADCLGSSPSYYETMQAADVDGQPGDELLARASDGLRMYSLFGSSATPGPTLTALAGAASNVPAGMWGSIRTANIDGKGGDEVLFLDPTGKGLQAYSYDPAAKAWKQMPASPALALGSDPWLSDPEYFSTIQTGDVDGDGRDDVIARGPTGIRTWFYDRRKTGGWERYLPEGYPGFPTTGQQNAFGRLNYEVQNTHPPLIGKGGTVRDVWASETAPDDVDIRNLQQALVSIGQCSEEQPGSTPNYKSCQKPAALDPPVQGVSDDFSADDWTAVVNEMLAENYAAGEVVAFFGDLNDIRQSLFVSEGAELPAIGAKLAALKPAAGSTTKFDAKEVITLILSVAGELSFVGEEQAVAAGVILSLTAETASTIPSGSATAQSTFETTYGNLAAQFAEMVTEINTSMNTQSFEVRRDSGLVGLISELRSSGTWKFDKPGMESAGNQGFALWAYKSLTPTMVDRYKVTNCWDGAGGPFMKCSGVPPSVAAFGNRNDLDTAGGMKNFVYPGPQFQGDGVSPCQKTFGDNRTCIYYGLSNDTLQAAWVTPPSDCIYVPGRPATAWNFSCPIGDDPELSVHRNSWGFNTYCGTPVAKACPGAVPAAAQARRSAPIRLGRSPLGRRRAARGRARFRAEIGIPRALRLAGATVGLKRVLFELRGHGELTRPRGSSAPRPLKLRRTGPGRFSAAARSGRPRARIVLRRIGRRRASLTLTAGARAFRAPLACRALPASLAHETPRVELETRFVIRNGRARHRVALPHHMRCRRDARGNIDRLVYIRNRPHRLRPGLALTLRGPRRVEPGSSARYVARVRNRRRAGDRLLSSLWDVTLAGRAAGATGAGAPHVTRIRELRAGRSRRLVITVRVPRAAKGRFCTHAVASAPAARADNARACAGVRAAGNAADVTG